MTSILTCPQIEQISLLMWLNAYSFDLLLSSSMLGYILLVISLLVKMYLRHWFPYTFSQFMSFNGRCATLPRLLYFAKCFVSSSFLIQCKDGVFFIDIYILLLVSPLGSFNILAIMCVETLTEALWGKKQYQIMCFNLTYYTDLCQDDVF